MTYPTNVWYILQNGNKSVFDRGHGRKRMPRHNVPPGVDCNSNPRPYYRLLALIAFDADVGGLLPRVACRSADDFDATIDRLSPYRRWRMKFSKPERALRFHYRG